MGERKGKAEVRRAASSVLSGVVAVTLLVGAAQPALALRGFQPPSSVTATPINENTETIAPGVVQNDYIFNDKDGQRMQSHVLNIDLPNHPELSIKSSLPDNGKDTPWYGMQPMSQQAAAATYPGHQVVAAINGDYFNMSNGYPVGVVVKDGVILKSSIDYYTSWKFFGVKKDGTYVMGDKTLFGQISGNLEEAISGDAQIVVNGQRDESAITGTSVAAPTSYDPRIGIGIRQDGTMFFVEVDGRQTGFSRGIQLTDFADYMISLGAYNAMEFDSGGSATFVTRTPGTDSLDVVNSPSDGNERPVANGFLLVSSASINHQFASASVSPNGKTVTPGSTVQFSAKGQDSTGASAGLPASGLSWSLPDASYGTIDSSTGLFTSNGKTGQFEVDLSYNGTKVGSAPLEVTIPDSLSFSQSEISLDYSAVKSLGLIARYQGRDVTLKPGDIVWSNIPDGMGTIDGQNVFHAASTGSFDTNITATFTGTNLSASTHTLLGQLPVVLYNFENGISDWSPGTAGKGESTSLQWNTYPNDLTRFGSHSLQINFDFTKGTTNSTLGCYAGPTTSEKIPGRPKAIGAWVYGTPESQGYWLRCYIYDAKGQYQPINFTGQATGINWTGWKYVEAPIPDTLVGPFTTLPNQMFRIMSLKSGVPGGMPMRKGFIVIDNVRVTYGANVDDLYPPIIHSINVDGKTYTSSHVEISSTFDEDTSDKYATGINYSRVRIYVDGKEYTNAKDIYALNKGLNTVGVSNLSFQDGVHRVDVDIQDNFGNETLKTAFFTVKAQNGTGLSFGPAGTSTPLGGTTQFSLKADNLSNITGATAMVNIGKDYPVTNVEFPASAGGSTYSYDASTGNLTLTIQNTGSAQGPGTLATVDVSVPASIDSGSSIAYGEVNGTATFATSQNSGFTGTFSSKAGTVSVGAALNVLPGQMVVGADGAVTVLNANNASPAQNATVTMTTPDGKTQTVGQTDGNGTLTSALLTANTQKFTLQAQSGTAYSFPTSAQSFTPQKTAAPVNLMAGATQDPTTEKTVTWMTNPLQGNNTAIMQVAKQSDYDVSGNTAFTTSFHGTRQLLTYATDSAAVELSSVTSTGLTPSTAYVYRVGDGQNWSNVCSFTTLKKDSDQLTFDVFGDTQVTDTSGLTAFNNFLTNIENSSTKPDFVVHVGDFTDDQTVWNEMDITEQMFNQHPAFDSIDEIHVSGNHEHMGDDGTKSASIFGMPTNNGPDVDKADTYSVDYGNMHIVSLGWTDSQDEMNQKMDWLRKDMKATRKTWKIIVTHQPAFNKNPADASTMFYDTLPKVCDELGVDLVFNGHDHTYGRTYPIYNYTANTTDPTNLNNGTAYIAAGHTGSKTYDMSPAQPWAFTTTQSEANNGDQVYLTCTVNNNKMHIVVTDAQNGATSDDVTLTAHAPNKTALESAITAAQAKAAAVQVGNNEGEYAQADLEAFKAAVTAAVAVNQNVNATPEEVDNAVSALAAATQTFEATAVTVDRTALAPLVTAAGSLSQSAYTPDSWTPFAAALASAQQVIAGHPSQEDINHSYVALLTAENNLVFAANKTALQAILTVAANTDTSNSKPAEIAALKQAVSDAANVLGDPNATQKAVDDATASVTTALNNLQDIVDRSNLTALIAAVQKLDSSKYSTASWQNLQTALTAAQATAEDLNNYAPDISTAYSSLTGALNTLVSRANKASISNTIGLARQIKANAGKYAPASIAGLNDALAQAQVVFNQDDATQVQVDAADKNLAEAIATARIRANVTDLMKLVSQDKSENLAGYTSVSVAAFRTALSKAETVMNDPNATQEQVNAAVASLINARNQLALLKTGTTPYTGGTAPFALIIVMLTAVGTMGILIRRCRADKRRGK